MNALYYKFFGITQDDLRCENEGNIRNAKVVLIDPEGEKIPRNIMCLCPTCMDAVAEGEINKSDLKYMHIVWMNRRMRIIKISE
jgi:hypothetical protein